MKSNFAAGTTLLIVAAMLAACSPGAATQTTFSSPEPTDPLVPTQVAAPPEVSQAAPTEPIPVSAPGTFPAGKGIHIGDHSTESSIYPRWALLGDRFTAGRFERPYNALKMDTYFPFLDIVGFHIFPDDEWTYVRITMVGRDEAYGFAGRYAVEIDSDADGRGDLFIMVANPDGREWSTRGVQVREDRNGDVGGATLMEADSQGAGDGYEFLRLGNGASQTSDLAWARLSRSDPYSVELAFKSSLLGGDDTYLAGAWAGTHALDPARFDLNDHFTHEQAGAADVELPIFYPIKGLAEVDATCRGAIGFMPTGSEPGICPGG